MDKQEQTEQLTIDSCSNNFVELENYTYRLEEMKDAMQQSVDNIVQVMSEQNDLIELVKLADKEQKFKQFIEESIAQLDKLEEQKRTLLSRQAFLNQVVERCKADERQAETISLLCEALGIFKS